MTCDSLVYAKVGVTYNRLKLRVDSASELAVVIGGGAPIEVSTEISNFIEKKEDRAVLRIGGGLEQRFCENFALRLDYTYSYYGKVCAEGKTSKSILGFDPAIATYKLEDRRSVKLTTNTVLAGLSYYFY